MARKNGSKSCAEAAEEEEEEAPETATECREQEEGEAEKPATDSEELEGEPKEPIDPGADLRRKDLWARLSVVEEVVRWGEGAAEDDGELEGEAAVLEAVSAPAEGTK